MKKSLLGLLCTIAFLQFTQLETKAVVGYANQVWPNGGYLLINNPLDDGMNTVSSLFASAPNGTTVELWNTGANSYTTASVKGPGGWSINYDLYPGTGARLYSPTSYTNTYVGEVVLDGGSGNYIDLGELSAAPPLPPATAGTYLLGTTFPIAGGGTNIFFWAVGRSPEVGESVVTMVDTAGTLMTHTYLGGDAWSNGSPTLNVAESAFFTLVPEPTTFTLLGVGSLALVIARRRR